MGLLFVHNRVSHGGFWKLTLGFLFITTSVDFSRTILGYFPYSEFIVAIICNVVGAPFAALVISYSTTLLFPEEKQRKAGSVSSLRTR